MVHPPAAAVHPRQLPPAAAVIPPLPQKGRPVHRGRTVTALTRAMVGMPASDPLTSRRPCTMQAGGTSLYQSAAILPRPGHRRDRPGPEELTPPPAPLRGEWCLAGFPCQALRSLARCSQREACLHGQALVAPPAPLTGGAALAEGIVAALLSLRLGTVGQIPGTIGRLRGRPGASLRCAPVPSACRWSAPPGHRPRVVSATAPGRQAARKRRAPPGLANTSATAPPVLCGQRARP